MLTAVIVVFPLMVLLIMVGHYTISSIRNDIKIMKKSIYYVVESKESAYVFKSKTKAVKKQSALLLAFREPVSLQVMEQMSLDDYIQSTEKRVTVSE